jgi:serine/threonine-protein kinase
MEIDVGRSVAGKYELVRLLGRGSMGEVWVGHHKTLGEHVAIKLLTRPADDNVLEDPATAAARFRFEAQVAARLSRKTRHIVRVTDHGEEDGLSYLVMELLEGETFESLLVRDGRLPLEVAIVIAEQIGRALTQAHGEGVFHRDLKPANVFLARDEEGKLLAKLLDFGIARAAHAHKAGPTAFATAKGVVFGTPSYMSPEQARGSSKLDHRCDLWALATILYEAVSGELPIEGTDTDKLIANLCAVRVLPLRAAARGLPEALDGFFARAFAEVIDERFQTAAELVQAFEGAVRGARVTAGAAAVTVEEATDTSLVKSAPGSVLDRHMGTGPARRRRRARIAMVSGAAIVLALGAVGVAWRASVPRLAGVPLAPTPAARAPTAESAQPTATTVLSPATPSDMPMPSSPAVPVSALPRVLPPRPGPAGRSVHPGTAASAAGGAATAAPPATTQQPAAPPPAKTVDKSEVF